MSMLPLTSSLFVALQLNEPHLLGRFERAGIRTLIDLALYTSLELSLKFRLSLNDAEEIIEKLFSTIRLPSNNAFDMLIQTSAYYIPTRLPTLNHYLHGGLRRGSLVELCGSWGRQSHSIIIVLQLLVNTRRT
jgi:hypothetical protein